MAYAIASKLGFAGSQVAWVVAAFDSVIQPGPKAFDFDINEVSYSADRAQAVDLSDGYFDNSQAVVAVKGAPITSAKSVCDLKAYRLGAQVGTTSYSYITDTIQPTTAARSTTTATARSRRSRPSRSTASSSTCRRRSTSPAMARCPTA